MAATSMIHVKIHAAAGQVRRIGLDQDDVVGDEAVLKSKLGKLLGVPPTTTVQFIRMESDPVAARNPDTPLVLHLAIGEPANATVAAVNAAVDGRIASVLMMHRNMQRAIAMAELVEAQIASCSGKPGEARTLDKAVVMELLHARRAWRQESHPNVKEMHRRVKLAMHAVRAARRGDGAAAAAAAAAAWTSAEQDMLQASAQLVKETRRKAKDAQRRCGAAMTQAMQLAGMKHPRKPRDDADGGEKDGGDEHGKRQRHHHRHHHGGWRHCHGKAVEGDAASAPTTPATTPATVSVAATAAAVITDRAALDALRASVRERRETAKAAIAALRENMRACATAETRAAMQAAIASAREAFQLQHATDKACLSAVRDAKHAAKQARHQVAAAAATDTKAAAAVAVDTATSSSSGSEDECDDAVGGGWGSVQGAAVAVPSMPRDKPPQYERLYSVDRDATGPAFGASAGCAAATITPSTPFTTVTATGGAVEMGATDSDSADERQQRKAARKAAKEVERAERRAAKDVAHAERVAARQGFKAAKLAGRVVKGAGLL